MNGLTVASLGFREGVARTPSQTRVRSRLPAQPSRLGCATRGLALCPAPPAAERLRTGGLHSGFPDRNLKAWSAREFKGDLPRHIAAFIVPALLHERQNGLYWFVNLNVFLFMAIACPARPDSCESLSSRFRASAAGVMNSPDLHGFLVDQDDETIR
jgi:hypothetical protein